MVNALASIQNYKWVHKVLHVEFIVTDLTRILNFFTFTKEFASLFPILNNLLVLTLLQIRLNVNESIFIERSIVIHSLNALSLEVLT